MTRLRELLSRLAAWVRRDTLDREFEEELDAHLALAVDELRARGHAQQEARRLALARFGGRLAAREQHARARGLPSLDALVRDAGQAVRDIRRRPGFIIASVVILGVALGMNAAVFVVANAVLVRGFPQVSEGSRVVYVTTNRGAVYYPDFEAWRDQGHSFASLALVRGVYRTVIDGSGGVDTVFATEVTADFFDVAGVRPLLGRPILPSDAQAGAAPVALLRHDFWQQAFDGDPDLVGHQIAIDGRPTTVIGIMPAGFSFPADQRLWLPLIPSEAAARRETYYAVYAAGRLAPAATLATARAELAAIGRRLAAAYPATNGTVVPQVQTFTERFVGAQAVTLYQALWGAAAFLFLGAATSVSHLFVERAAGRSQELAIRLALGASRSRLIRAGIAEALVVASAAAGLGLAIAHGALRLFVAAPFGFRVTSLLDYHLDRATILYLVGLSIAATLAGSLLAVWRTTSTDVEHALRTAGRGTTDPLHRRRLARALLASQVALVVVLMAGASLMLRGLANLVNADLGVDAAPVLTMSLFTPPEHYPDGHAVATFYADLQARLQELPGITRVGLGSGPPAGQTAFAEYSTAAPPDAGPGWATTAMMVVNEDYFPSLAIRLLRGRPFARTDTAGGTPVAIVNQRFAAEHWPDGTAVGRRMHVRRGRQAPVRPVTVIAVVSNVVQNGRLSGSTPPVLYLPFSQHPQGNMFAFVQADVPPAGLASAVRAAVHGVDPALPVPALMPLADRLDALRVEERNLAVFVGLFAAVALTLMAGGLHVMVARAVRTRTREIGIRAAVGGAPRDIASVILDDTIRPLAGGLAGGLVLALPLAPWLARQLAGVSPTDPLTWCPVPLVLAVAALCGCAVPLRRALAIDPVTALRHD
ncbi:MAG: ADOP family duplicated permease [Vicinamibacterales bacterium]